MARRAALSEIPNVDAAADQTDLALSLARRRHRVERIVSLFSPLILLILWELSARAHWIDTRFFPAPSKIIAVWVKMIASGEYFSAVGISLTRIIIGFLLGAVPALILGIIMGLSTVVRALLNPIFGTLMPIPKLALLPLILLVFGMGELSKWVTIGAGLFFHVLYNTMTGVVNIDSIYIDAARNYGATRADFFFRIALPGALPNIINGIRLALSVGLLLIVAAEMIGATNGIGHMIWQGYEVFALEQMYVGLLTMALFGYLITHGDEALEKVVIPWKR